MAKILNEVRSSLKTFICFSITCLLVPVLTCSAIFAFISTEFINYVLRIKYPKQTISKSKKIRTLIDTSRNAGIFHFFLQVRGPCDFNQIRQFYNDHLTEARDVDALLKFPKLYQKLVSCWGHYAWVNDTSSFNINDHVLLSPRTYRGRPVNDGNIQDFVSELVTKYIPSDIPQWQVIVIPISKTISGTNNEGSEHMEDDHYYILVKLHHLIIAEDEDLHISDILMLRETNDGVKPVELSAQKNMENCNKLAHFVRTPTHIHNLLHHLAKAIEHYWNAFIYDFESLETPDGQRAEHIKTLSRLLSVMLIIIVSVAGDYRRTMNNRQKHSSKIHPRKYRYSKWQILVHLLQRATNRRHLSFEVARKAVWKSLHPIQLIKTWTQLLWYLSLNYAIRLPYRIYCEYSALRELLTKEQTIYTETFCYRAFLYVPLVSFALIELWMMCHEIYRAPVNIYETLFENPSKESNILQKKSYSGRKIISYSKSIDSREIREKNKFYDDVRESDFVLACLAGAIHDYFDISSESIPVPRILNTTCRTIIKGYFTENTGDKMDSIGGIVFLQLPLKKPDWDHVRHVHSIVDEIRRKQIMIYLASMGQTKYSLLTSLLPQVLTKICINFFSFNFPITITEIYGANSNFHTIWGHQVDDVLLFRPPQSKTCLSLNIHRFGDKYRLAIMADTQLGPDHIHINHAFENYMQNTTL